MQQPPPPIHLPYFLRHEDGSALDFVERSSAEVFDWETYEHSNGCPGGPLDHILGCHGQNSDKGKSEFNSNVANEVYHLIEEAAAKVGQQGLKNATRVAGDRNAREVLVRMADPIGKVNGTPTHWIKIYFEAAKDGGKWILRNAFPDKGLGAG